MILKQIKFYVRNIVLSIRSIANPSRKQKINLTKDTSFITHVHTKIHELDRMLTDHESCAITTCKVNETQSQHPMYRHKMLENWETKYLLNHRGITSILDLNNHSQSCIILGIPREKLLHDRTRNPIIFLEKGNIVELLNA